MNIAKIFFSMCLTALFFVSIASSGMVMKLEMQSVKGENYQKANGNLYIVPLASRVDMEISMPPQAKSEGEEEAELVQQTATMIVRLDKEVFWMIMPESESYFEFTFEEFKKMQEKGKNPLPDGPQSLSAGFGYKRAKGGKNIIGCEAKKYNIWDDNFKGTAWVTNKRFRTLEKFVINQAMAFFRYQISGMQNKIPGLVLEQKIKTNDGVLSSMKVKSIGIKRFSERTFSVPEGFTEVDLQAWMSFKESITPGKIWSKVKEEVKEEAKEEVKSQGKKAAKNAVKGLLGF